MFNSRDDEFEEFCGFYEDQEKVRYIVDEGLRVYADHLVQFVQKLGALCPLLKTIHIDLEDSAVGICYKLETERVEEGHGSLSTVTWNFILWSG